MKKWIAGLLLGSLSGILLSFLFVTPFGNEIPLSELILQLSGSNGVFVITPSVFSLIELFIRLLPDCVFMLLYGTFLYRHYCTAGVYIFSRVLNRRTWFYRECVHLWEVAFVYVVVQTAAVLVTSVLRLKVLADEAGLWLVVCWVLLDSLWTFFWTLLINCVAIRTGGSEKGAVTAFGLQALSYGIVGTLEFCQRVLHLITEEGLYTLLPVSLISHVVVGWHTASAPVLKEVLSGMIPTRVGDSLILLTALSLALVLVTGHIIQRMDILGVNTEGK